MRYINASQNRHRVKKVDLVPFDNVVQMNFERGDLRNAVNQAQAIRLDKGHRLTTRVELKKVKENQVKHLTVGRGQNQEIDEDDLQLTKLQKVKKKEKKEAKINLDDVSHPKIVLKRLINGEIQQCCSETEPNEVSLQLDDKWKNDFLASLDDESSEDEEENKENNQKTLEMDKENVRKVKTPKICFKQEKRNLLIEEKQMTSDPRSPLQEIKMEEKSVRKAKPDGKEEESDYEKIRQRNIKEKENMYKEIMKEFSEKEGQMMLKKKVTSKPPQRRTPTVISSPRRSMRGEGKGQKRYRDESDDEDEDGKRRRKRYKGEVKVKIGVPVLQGRKSNPNVDVPTPEDINDFMMENVADRVSEKIYDKVQGSSCHQCRQKTMDTKTVCRSGICVGVRGKKASQVRYK